MISKDFSGTPELPDLSFLREMLEYDEESLKEIISIFLEDGPPMIKSLENYAGEKDFDMVKQVSHTLITELSTVGITSVITDLKRINKSAKDMPDLEETILRIRGVVERSSDYFRSIL